MQLRGRCDYLSLLGDGETRLNANRKLACAVSAILAGYGSARNTALASDSDASDTTALQEIIVTAQRREQSIQDVPTTIQALSGEQLQQLNISTFDALLEYTPNVTYTSRGPGDGNIFMRGLSTGSGTNQFSATLAPFPNVAVFLDDQSVQFPGRNLDVYMVDLQRVEVLEGPQGTLFGGSAQAGAIRYITNKPKLDTMEGSVNASYGSTAGGDPNSSVNATINLPIINDTLAIRATVFDDRRGGYISNVPGTICNVVQPTVCANNYLVVGSNQNSVTYTGLRVSALIKFNDNWNALIQQNFQNMDTEGYFAEYPTAADGSTLAPYQIAAFSPAHDHDRYESTAWTLNGQLGDYLKVIYTGSFLDRHIDEQADYANYLRSASGQYYSCTGAGSGGLGGSTKPLTCYAPQATWHDQVQNTHQSHELRLSTNDDNRLRGIGGVYWEEFIAKDEFDETYMVIPQCDAQNLAIAEAGGPDCVSAVGPVPGYYATDPNLRTGSNDAYGGDTKRGYRQLAFFASVDFDIIPKVLTVTAGTRYYHYDEFEEGSEFYTSTSANDVPNGVCTATGGCGFGINLSKKESGSRSRGNLTWHITPDAMAYYTFSQGFRPGGFNRTETLPNGTIVQAGEAPYVVGGKALGEDQYAKPAGYNSDDLTNNEIGAKTEWFDHRLLVNASAYIMNWTNVQIPLLDVPNLGNTNFAVNGPSYQIKGIELQTVARVTRGLTIQGSASWNSSNQTDTPCLLSVTPGTGTHTANNPTPAGECITQINGHPYTNPFGLLNTTPPFSPPLEFNLRARYDWNFQGYTPFITVGANHIASMATEPASFPSGTSSTYCIPVPITTLCRYVLPGYTTYDGAIGVIKDRWTAQLTGSNLSNSDASTYTASNQEIETKTPLRPRVLTLSFGYRF